MSKIQKLFIFAMIVGIAGIVFSTLSSLSQKIGKTILAVELAHPLFVTGLVLFLLIITFLFIYLQKNK